MYQLTFWKFFQNQKHIYQLSLEKNHTSTHAKHTDSELCLLLSVYPPMVPNFYQKTVTAKIRSASVLFRGDT